MTRQCFEGKVSRTLADSQARFYDDPAAQQGRSVAKKGQQ